MNYTGAGDRFLDFPDNSVDFSNAESMRRTVKIKLVSAASGDVDIVLIPNSLSTSGIVVTDGAIGSTSVTASSLGIKSIASFLESLKRKPMDLLSVDIKSDDEAQLATSIRVKEFMLFESDKETLINVEEFKDPYQQDGKRAIVKFDNVSADGDTEVKVKIPAGATTTFSLTFGAAISLPYALKESRKSAKATLKK